MRAHARFALIAVLALAACSRRPADEVDEFVTKLGATEVSARLVEIPGTFPSNDLYNYTFILKYKVLKVHRGSLTPGAEILVGQYNPLKPRETAADDDSGKIGGHVKAFRAGDIHRMALDAPLDKAYMGGIVDNYFGAPGTRYWALWTNPGAE